MNILLPRYIANNVGDLMSRHGLLKSILERDPEARIIIVTDSDQSFFPCPVKAVPPGPFKDALPRPSQLGAIKRGDNVLWACGHDMTDESSLLLIPHMYFKLLTYKMLGLKVHVVAQGAGPLKTAWGRFFVRRIVRLAHSVSMRDPISRALVAKVAQVPEERVQLSADTAVLATSTRENGGDKAPMVLGVNLRRWHHLTGGLIPYEYKARMGAAKTVPGQDIMDEFATGMAAFLDRAVDKYGLRVLFIPMYPPGKEPWEDDAALGASVRERMARKDAARCHEGSPAPSEMVEVFSGLDLMLGVRLHSTIVPTSMGIPAIHLAYSPKGFAYYDRLGMPECCMPLEDVTMNSKWENLGAMLDNIIVNKSRYEEHLSGVMPHMRRSARQALDIVDHGSRK